MRILLTNDDGIDAPGLRALHEVLDGLGELTVVAPAREQSGVSHAFSLKGPINVRKIDHNGSLYGYAVDGTPVDSVKVAVRALLPAKPDLVVSGINWGENTGVDLLYSGTVAAAMEAASLDIPAIAVSLTSKEYRDFTTAAHFARLICERVIEHGIPNGNVLNVNVPPLPLSEIRGVRVTTQAKSFYVERLEGREDGDGIDYHWTSWNKSLSEDKPDVDVVAIREGCVSITPIHARLTEHSMLDTIKGWDLGVS